MNRLSFIARLFAAPLALVGIGSVGAKQGTRIEILERSHETDPQLIYTMDRYLEVLKERNKFRDVLRELVDGPPLTASQWYRKAQALLSARETHA